MSLMTQIAIGSALLGLCSALHLIVLIRSVSLLRRLHRKHLRLHWGWLITGAFLAVVLGHTAQVWLWALAFLGFDLFSTLDEAMYFSLTTYTTLGYGDIIVGEGTRVFAAMGAVTGLLNFGLSTAFLVELVTRYLPRHPEDER